MEHGHNVIAFRTPASEQGGGDSGDETTPRSLQQPMLSHGKTAHANAERTLMELEQAIAALVKESDGCSRIIPRLRTIHNDLTTHIRTLKP